MNLGCESIIDFCLVCYNKGIVICFQEIIKLSYVIGCLNISIGVDLWVCFGFKKMVLCVFDFDCLVLIIMSMFDDLLYYLELCILMVCENVWLQSFFDWYLFYGKYMMGGYCCK